MIDPELVPEDPTVDIEVEVEDEAGWRLLGIGEVLAAWVELADGVSE